MLMQGNRSLCEVCGSNSRKKRRQPQNFNLEDTATNVSMFDMTKISICFLSACTLPFFPRTPSGQTLSEQPYSRAHKQCFGRQQRCSSRAAVRLEAGTGLITSGLGRRLGGEGKQAMQLCLWDGRGCEKGIYRTHELRAWVK